MFYLFIYLFCLNFRLGLLPNSPSEHKKLAIDVCDMIINWEKQRVGKEALKAEKGI